MDVASSCCYQLAVEIDCVTGGDKQACGQMHSTGIKAFNTLVCGFLLLQSLNNVFFLLE